MANANGWASSSNFTDEYESYEFNATDTAAASTDWGWSPWSLSSTLSDESELNMTTTTASVERASTRRASETLLWLYVVFGSLGIAGNLFVTIVILFSPTLRRKKTNVLIVNQSVVDGLASLFILLGGTVLTSPPSSFARLTHSLADQISCRMLYDNVALFVLIVASTYSILSVTAERYLAVVHPIVHKTRLSRAGVTALVVLPWIISIVYNMATGVAFSGFVGSACVSLNQLSGASLDVFGVWTLIVEYLAPLFIMGACYARMIMALRSKVASDITSTGLSSAIPSSAIRSSGIPSSGIPSALVRPTVTFMVYPAPASVAISSTNSTPEAPAAPDVIVSHLVVSDPPHGPPPLGPPLGLPPPAAPAAPSLSSRARARANILKTLLLVCLCFVVCQSCNQFLILIYSFGLVAHPGGPFYEFTVMAVFLNCCLNPLIYAAQYRQFQASVLRLAEKIKRAVTGQRVEYYGKKRTSTVRGAPSLAIDF